MSLKHIPSNYPSPTRNCYTARVKNLEGSFGVVKLERHSWVQLGLITSSGVHSYNENANLYSIIKKFGQNLI